MPATLGGSFLLAGQLRFHTALLLSQESVHQQCIVLRCLSEMQSLRSDAQLCPGSFQQASRPTHHDLTCYKQEAGQLRIVQAPAPCCPCRQAIGGCDPPARAPIQEIGCQRTGQKSKTQAMLPEAPIKGRRYKLKSDNSDENQINENENE